MIEQDIARLCFHVFNTVTSNVGHLDQVGICLFSESFDLLSLSWLELIEVLQIDLGQYNDEGLRLEERFDRVE